MEGLDIQYRCHFPQEFSEIEIRTVACHSNHSNVLSFFENDNTTPAQTGLMVKITEGLQDQKCNSPVLNVIYMQRAKSYLLGTDSTICPS